MIPRQEPTVRVSISVTNFSWPGPPAAIPAELERLARRRQHVRRTPPSAHPADQQSGGLSRRACLVKTASQAAGTGIRSCPVGWTKPSVRMTVWLRFGGRRRSSSHASRRNGPGPTGQPAIAVTMACAGSSLSGPVMPSAGRTRLSNSTARLPAWCPRLR